LLFMGALLSACSHTSEVKREVADAEAVNVDYSVIYYIHADSDYLYHDTTGTPVYGNSRVLNDAHQVAENADSGEVFIFYQRPEKNILWLIPRRSSRLYHYVNGERVSQVHYRHADSREAFLTTEARLFNQYSTQSGNDNHRKLFLYFGHEIPEDGGESYHRTKPNITVNTGSFSNGLQKFLANEDQRFDLVALSTCNNGTPVMADHLISFTDVMLASPQNLHLSHINSEKLGLLESEPGISTTQLARAIADHTYSRLASEVQTAITLTVYDFEIVQAFKNELNDAARAYDSLDGKQYFSENVDCVRHPFFDDDVFRNGLETWYRPARFGRGSRISDHSGWGCKPLGDIGGEK